MTTPHEHGDKWELYTGPLNVSVEHDTLADVIQRALQEERQRNPKLYEPQPGQIPSHVDHRVARITADVAETYMGAGEQWWADRCRTYEAKLRESQRQVEELRAALEQLLAAADRQYSILDQIEGAMYPYPHDYPEIMQRVFGAARRARKALAASEAHDG